jgi:hypothetical protein
MAGDKGREIFKLYEEMLMAASDVRPEQAPILREITNFMYTAFVGLLHQWLATGDRDQLLKTTDDLIEATQLLVERRLSQSGTRKTTARPKNQARRDGAREARRAS